MRKQVTGLIAICLMGLLTGCASFSDQAMPLECNSPQVPAHLTNELPAPTWILQSNKGLLLLLAKYEALRRRFNADRAAVVEILMSQD
ncbi:hypothetical protein KV699_12295 [Vreelandella titanicae]|uniref:hypothetical protein n=1 Tax=Halomonadaceae TaxID=28256 RepID=UPI00059B01A4|nr:hypothetical protein [Halomonas sp. KHS3]KIN12840.1 hypothetical protein RO22_22945 [Halomonas sp. KHS3]